MFTEGQKVRAIDCGNQQVAAVLGNDAVLECCSSHKGLTLWRYGNEGWQMVLSPEGDLPVWGSKDGGLLLIADRMLFSVAVH
jgi:hypothetical protein